MSGSDWKEPPPTTRPADAEAAVPVEDLVLEVVSGPDRGRSLALGPGTWVVGKLGDCALALTDPEVSRMHLELRVESLGVLVRDLGSKNGSFYRGARISEVLVGAGATFTIGNTRLTLARRVPPDQIAPSESTRFGRMIGHSLIMRQLFAYLDKVAPTTSPILLESETGTGKELCAEAIHQASGRAGPFVVCDLGGINRSLIESELYGHAKGAFTGATADRVGAFESAHGGTLFLDEVGELDLELQPRLLRVLENHAVRPLGETRYREIDVRVIAATHHDLDEEVRSGTFRADLFHRLAVVRVRIPPLREHREDLPFLVEEMLAGRGGRASPATLALLEEHDWPGNIRELRNVIDRGLAVTAPGAALEPEALGLDTGAAAAAPVELEDYHLAKQRLLEAWERKYIDDLLSSTPGGVSEAARRCGLARAHVYRLMQKYQIKR